MAKTIKCPNCGSGASLMESRHLDNNVYRKYKCIKCGFIFYTKEHISDEAWEEITRYHREYYRARKGGKQE